MKTTQSAGDYSKEGVRNEKVKKVKKKLNTEYCKARRMAKAKEKAYSELYVRLDTEEEVQDLSWIDGEIKLERMCSCSDEREINLMSYTT